MAALKALLAENPMDIAARFALAVTLEDLGQPEGAASEFESLVQQESLRAPSLAHLAALDRARGRADRAIERLRALVSDARTSKDLVAYELLIETLRREGRLDGELATLDASRGDRHATTAWDAVRRALVLEALGREAAAPAAALQALLLDPTDDAARGCAVWLSDGGRRFESWSALIAEDPVPGPPGPAPATETRRLMTRALLLRWQGKSDEALAAAKRAAALGPGQASAHLLLGETLSSIPLHRGAAGAELRRALEIDPALLPAYVVLGRLHLVEGRASDAELAATAAIAARPLDAPAYVLLGEARLAAGAAETALIAFRSALFLDPYDRDGLGRLGLYLALSRLGREAEGPVILSSLLPNDPAALAQEREQFRRSLGPRAGRIRTLSAGRVDAFLTKQARSASMRIGAAPDVVPTLRILADGSLLHVNVRKRSQEVKP